MKQYVFFCDKQIPMVSPVKETLEFKDDVTDEEVQQAFTEWVINQLDTGYWEEEAKCSEKSSNQN